MPPAAQPHLNSGLEFPNLATQWNQYSILQGPSGHSFTSTEQVQQSPHIRRQINNGLASADPVPHPPPPYTPTVSLHAPILAPTMVDSATPSYPSEAVPSTTPDSPPSNPRIVLGAILLSSVLAIFAASVATLFLKRRQVKLRVPNFGRFRRARPSPRTDNTRMLVLDDSKPSEENLAHPNGSVYRTSAVLGYYQHKREEIEDQYINQEVSAYRNSGVPLNQMDLASRRYSSPAQINVEIASGTFSPDPALQRPMSMPPPGSEVSMYIQQQKEAELAQIMRMKIVRDESSVTMAPSLPPSLSSQRKSVSISHGIGLVHDKNGIDIASTVLSSLHRLSFSAGPNAPTVPVTDLFKVDGRGKVVYANQCSLVPSKSDPESLGSSESEVSMAETDIVDGGIIEVRMAHTRSMEMKRGILVSLGPSSTDVPQLLVSTPSSQNNICASSISRTSSLGVTPVDDNYLRPDSPTALDYEMADFPSPPPVLSPILPSSFALSTEIQNSLEGRVFSYRDSGPWSKDGYRLSTPGQIRALVDALELRKPSVDNRERSSWPWPTRTEHASEV